MFLRVHAPVQHPKDRTVLHRLAQNQTPRRPRLLIRCRTGEPHLRLSAAFHSLRKPAQPQFVINRRAIQGRPSHAVLSAQALPSPKDPGASVDGANAIVRFNIPYEAGFGNYLKVVGGHESLGNWQLSSAPVMEWREGDVWTVAVQIPQEQDVEFKFAVVTRGGDVWEICDNRLLKVPTCSSGGFTVITANCLWNDVAGTDYQVEGIDDEAAQEVNAGATVAVNGALHGGDAVQAVQQQEEHQPLQQEEEEEEEPLEDDGSWIPVADEVPEDGLVGVKVAVQYEADIGCYLKLVGSEECMGSWTLEAAPTMEWTEGHQWMANFRVAEGSTLEFKFVWCSPNSCCWEGCDNRLVAVAPPEGFECSLAEMTVNCKWNSEVISMKYVAAPSIEPPPQPTPLDSLDEVNLALDDALLFDSDVSDLIIEEMMKSQDLDDTLSSLSDTETDDEEGFDELYNIEDLDDTPAPEYRGGDAYATDLADDGAGDHHSDDEDDEIEDDVLRTTNSLEGITALGSGEWGSTATTSMELDEDDETLHESVEEELLPETSSAVATLTTTTDLDEPKDWRSFSDSSYFRRSSGVTPPAGGYQVHLESPLFDYLEATPEQPESLDQQFWNESSENLVSNSDAYDPLPSDHTPSQASQEDQDDTETKEVDREEEEQEEEHVADMSAVQQDFTADEDLESAVKSVVSGVSELEAALDAMQTSMSDTQPKNGSMIDFKVSSIVEEVTTDISSISTDISSGHQAIQDDDEHVTVAEEETMQDKVLVDEEAEEVAAQGSGGSSLAEAMGLKFQSDSSNATSNGAVSAPIPAAEESKPTSHIGRYDDIWQQYKQLLLPSSASSIKGASSSSSPTVESFNPYTNGATYTSDTDEDDTAGPTVALEEQQQHDVDGVIGESVAVKLVEATTTALPTDEAVAVADEDDGSSSDEGAVQPDEEVAAQVNGKAAGVIEVPVEQERAAEAQDIVAAAQLASESMTIDERDSSKMNGKIECDFDQDRVWSEYAAVSTGLAANGDKQEGLREDEGSSVGEVAQEVQLDSEDTSSEQAKGVQEIQLEDGSKAVVEEQQDGCFVYRFDLQDDSDEQTDPSVAALSQESDSSSPVDTSLANIARTLKSLNDSLALVDQSLALVDQQYGLGSSSESDDEESVMIGGGGADTASGTAGQQFKAVQQRSNGNGISSDLWSNGDSANGDALLSNGVKPEPEAAGGDTAAVAPNGNGLLKGVPQVQHSSVYTKMSQQ